MTSEKRCPECGDPLADSDTPGITADLTEADDLERIGPYLERIVELYENWARPERVAEWRARASQPS